MELWDANSITLLALALVLVLILIVGFRTRPQPSEERRDDFEEAHPHVVVTAGEIVQIARIPDGQREGYYEPIMSLRIMARNVGQGFASGVKAWVNHGNATYWESAGSIDLAGREKEELPLVLPSVRMPPLSPERENWLDVTLRLEYQDIGGKGWFTQLPIKVKLVHDVVADRHACWWIELMEPEVHGKIEEATWTRNVPGEAPAADALEWPEEESPSDAQEVGATIAVQATEVGTEGDLEAQQAPDLRTHHHQQDEHEDETDPGHPQG